MPRVISVIGRKGGVGKTTSTVHIASRLADMGFRTCVIDYDTTQSNATRSIVGPIWESEPERTGICDLINNDGKLDDVIMQTSRENLFIVPSEKNDSRGNPYNVEGVLTQIGLEGYQLLKILIEESEMLKDMQFVLIDNAPNLGITSVSSLLASDYFIVPVQTEDLSMESIADTINAGLKVKKLQNPYLEPLGFFVSCMDKRPKMAKQAVVEMHELAEKTGIHFFETQIPISTKFGFLPREMKTIFDVTKKSDRGHKEYLMLVDEMLERIQSIEASEVNVESTQAEMR